MENSKLLMVPQDLRKLVMEQYHDHDISGQMAKGRVNPLLKDSFLLDEHGQLHSGVRAKLRIMSDD
jgi:hypothetical protein